MTLHRLTNIALSLGLAVALAAILGSSHLLDDNSAEWAQSTALRDAQQQAQAEARRERAAQQLCVKLHGPGVAAGWDADDRLVCTARRGPARTVVAGGAL
jgi:hypothetical protein